MTIDKMIELFEKYEEEYVSPSDRKIKNSQLHVFLLLDKMGVLGSECICAAEHDIIYLDVRDMEKFAELADEDLIRELSICGVFLYEQESLAMWV